VGMGTVFTGMGHRWGSVSVPMQTSSPSHWATKPIQTTFHYSELSRLPYLMAVSTSIAYVSQWLGKYDRKRFPMIKQPLSSLSLPHRD